MPAKRAGPLSRHVPLIAGQTATTINTTSDATAALIRMKRDLQVAVKPLLVKKDALGLESPLHGSLIKITGRTKRLILLTITRLL